MSLYLGDNLISGNSAQIDKVAQEIPLGASRYSGETLEANLGWLKSAGQWNGGTVYTTFYNTAVGNIGDDFAKGKIVASTDTYTDYDLVVNTSQQTFRLPLLDGSEDILSNKYDDLTLNSSGSTYTAPANGYMLFSGVSTANDGFVMLGIEPDLWWQRQSTETGDYMSVSIPVLKNDVVRVYYQSLKTTDLYFRFIYAQGNGDLYFKVANAVQNLDMLDAAQITNALTLKADVDLTNVNDAGKIAIAHNAMPSNTRTTLTAASSYTAPADGWFRFQGTTTVANGYVYASVTSGNGYYDICYAPASGYTVAINIPVSKGQTLSVGFGGATASVYTFIYAQGSESEAS